MNKEKKIAIVAHDNCKQDLIEWVSEHWVKLIENQLICTGTTGNLVENKLKNYMNRDIEKYHLNITKLKSGPLGGDQQLGALISNNEVDILIFFWDAMEPQPHDVDIKALLRIATLYNIVYACSRSSADFFISSPLMATDYKPKLPEQITMYQNRKLK